jgi:hypothetical protein
VLRQLGYREGVRLQTRILDVDFKNDASDDGTRFGLGRELFRGAQHDPAVDRLPTGSIAPPELPHFPSIPAFVFDEASVLYAAPLCTAMRILSAGR